MNKILNRSVLIGSTFITAFFLAAVGRSSDKADTKFAQASTTTPPSRTQEAQAKMSPQEAIDKLRAGNARFVSGKTRRRDLQAEVRATAGAQYPFAVILSCLDSRQPVELLFDQGIGDVFNARVAGNVLNDDIVASMEFACKVSGSKLILVLGHSNCGAIKGAVDNVELGKLSGLLDKIKPAAAQVPANVQPRTSKNDDFVQKTADANVRLVMQQIRERSTILREMLDAGTIALEGGMYNLATGEVTLWPK
jgi:carbonic anhydrase